ncbi:lycopene beta-cyclase CrtY [Aurantiacibacter sp. MUD61]|uniref:lycopene beta-cyclase CrtY n=1 Tax=Aurantiacibacter sp. MUD61 TaxID=3009083 RepID=UPI0022F0F17F|nr:lycopene beta-cyclase CrtY [Aurantiacibacter sp. MUD61]
MSGRICDIAIVGGGLSGGLIALALAWHRPELRVRLIESGPALGGNHRWSWFSTDLSPEGNALMERFRKTTWDDGYAIHFPDLKRELDAGYLSLTSEDFAAALERELAPGTILTGKEVSRLSADAVELADGTTITARSVIDCRGFAPSSHLNGGWQVFMGRHVHTPEPHGVTRPIIMDACVDQVAPAGNGGAYRFVYVLPLGAHDVFVEDTYYADRPDLDRSALSGRIDQYCRQHGLGGEPVSFETGVLPVITGGNFRAYQEATRIPGVTVAGGRGGFVHPLTSYTLPIAVNVALAIVEDADLPGEQLSAKIEAQARRHWSAMGFYRALGRMLFIGAEPEDRFRIFERFYGLPEPLIERFYAGHSTFLDRARTLIGKPPIPIWRGAHALFSNSPPLTPSHPKDTQ